ncbi:MAG: amidase, partial [Tepidisphaeraceae bacterium]
MGPGTPSKRQLFIAAASVSALLVSRSALADFNVVGADIPELENAYATDETTVTDVVQQYLNRIAEYNLPNAGGINAVFEVNPNILSEAEAEDTMIADGATEAQYPLLGVPVLVKGSYDVAGLITDNGVSILAGGEGSNTPGETTLIPTTNAFSVQQLIDAGALIIGKSNMSTMAYSYDGIDNAGGAVVNPFNPLRIPGGSSSGIGAGISANFAMLGMGGETGGSIRVPSDADGDVGLKTSAGLIDPGGTWPLTPSRDVVGPIAKDVTDIAYAMNALVAPSPTNLWNNTPYYPTSEPGSVRPADYTSFLQTTALEGKVIAVPNSMTGVGTQYEGTESPVVLAAFNNALTVMQNEGATIVHVNIPASVLYYSTIGSSGAGTPATTTGFPYPYPTTTVGGTVPATAWSNDAAAYYYEKQIESYHDPVIQNLQDFANALQAGANLGAGSPFSTLKSAASNIKSLAAIYEAGQAAGFESTNGVPDNPNAIEALQGLTDLRNAGINDFMADPG